MYVRELCVRYRLRRLPGRQLPGQLNNPAAAAEAFARLLVDEPVEVCGVFCLSIHQNVLAYHELSRGTLDAALVHPRDVFKVALLANAHAVIVGHNHPSGDPAPSVADVTLTRRLVSAGELIGIALLDHLIVAGEKYVSFKETGWLAPSPTHKEG